MKHVLTDDNTKELIDLSKFIKHILDKLAKKCGLIINYNTKNVIVYITCNTLIVVFCPTNKQV